MSVPRFPSGGPTLTRLFRLSAFLAPIMPVLVPLAVVAGFFAGRVAERNLNPKVPTITQIRVDDLKDERKVRLLLDRYKKAMQEAAGRFETEAHRMLTPEERRIFEWLHTNTHHPCPLPDEMLAFHAMAVMNASRELVLVGLK